MGGGPVLLAIPVSRLREEVSLPGSMQSIQAALLLLGQYGNSSIHSIHSNHSTDGWVIPFQTSRTHFTHL